MAGKRPHDLPSLSVAVAYCDVVVTEKHWANIMRRGELDRRNGTKVVTSVADLVPVLIEAA